MRSPDLTKIGQMLGFLLFMAIGIGGYLLPEVCNFSCVPGDLGDTRFNTVILEHLYRWIGGRDQSLWSPSFFYPFNGVLAFSDNHFGSAIFYIVFRWLGFAREGAYSGWFIVGALLNYVVTYFVLRRLDFSSLASAAGAFVFSFSLPTLFIQAIHAQLIYRFATPLAMLGFIRALKTGRVFYLWQTLFWLAVQFYCSIYLGIFLAYLLAACVFASLFFAYERRNLVRMAASLFRGPVRDLMAVLAAAAIAAVAIGWLLYWYQMISREYGLSRSPIEVSWMLPRLGSYLISDRSKLSSWVGAWITDVPTRGEQYLFVGIGVLIVVMVGAFSAMASRRDEAFGRMALMSFGVLFLITLYVNGQSIYLWLIKIPGLNAIRAVSRIMLVMLLPISILTAIGVDRIRRLGILQNRTAMLLFPVGLAALIGVETIFFKPFNEPTAIWTKRIAVLKPLLPERLIDRPILFVGRSHNEFFNFTELDGMVLAQDMGIPTLNGYSGNIPPGVFYFDADPCIPYITRLYAYTDFRKLPRDVANDLARHVVHLAPEKCRGDVIVGSNHRISVDQAKLIQISIGDVDPKMKHVAITITNNSTEPFNPISSKGNIRLACRYVPLSPDGVDIGNSGMDGRKDWWYVIEPGESVSMPMEAQYPQSPGRYRLEVTMVQEGVVWLHELGMPIAVANVDIGGRN